MTIVVLVILAVITVGLLWLPMIRGQQGTGEEGLAVYRDQLKELERDLAAGLIDADAVETARREIERRILNEANKGSRAAGISQASLGLSFTVVLSLAVIVLAVVIYGSIGSPGLPNQPLSARMDTATPEGGDLEMQALVARAEARVGDNPFDREGWFLLANTYAFAQRYGDATRAMAEVLALDANDPTGLARYGEYITLSRDGAVTPAAREAFVQALTLDPGQPVARYYEGIARAQDDDMAGALAVWRALMAESTGNDPWVAQLQRHIADAEALLGDESDVAVAEALPGPTEEDIAAAAEMTADEQLEMIRGMVEGLAARLEDEPDNLEGWMRLAQSYAVLGEWQGSRDAYDHALVIAPGDPALVDGFANAVAAIAQSAPTVPAASVEDMERVLALQPDNAQALYVTGLAGAQSGDRELARERWTALRNLFPENSGEYGQADQLINSLQ